MPHSHYTPYRATANLNQRKQFNWGSIAEGAFERVATAKQKPYEHFGVTNETPKHEFWSMPDVFKKAPDYITNASLIECQGVGRNGLDHGIRLKQCKLEAMRWWRKHITDCLNPRQVLFFFWDSVNRRASFCTLEYVESLIGSTSPVAIYPTNPDDAHVLGWFLPIDQIFDAHHL